MPGTQSLLRRIKSVKSTRKVTKAMQMVSASKMRKAQVVALTSRKYTELAWNLISEMDPKSIFTHPLVQEFPKAGKIGVIIVSTNKGLVGSLNTNLFSKLKSLEQENPGLSLETIVMGRKAKEFLLKRSQSLIADFEKTDTHSQPEEIYPLAHLVTAEYHSGKYQKVFLLYNEFVSTLVQKPKVKQLLPIEPKISNSSEHVEKNEFVFEPSPESVLNHLLPRIVESQIFQAVVESDASEHSARMIMMKNATEAAGDLISDLTLTFNQLRQSKITTELSEITAGKLALEKK